MRNRSRTSTSSAAVTATPPPPTTTTVRVSAQMEESGLTDGGVGGLGSFCSLVDEIEEFSSQEEPGIHVVGLKAYHQSRSIVSKLYSSTLFGTMCCHSSNR